MRGTIAPPPTRGKSRTVRRQGPAQRHRPRPQLRRNVALLSRAAIRSPVSGLRSPVSGLGSFRKTKSGRTVNIGSPATGFAEAAPAVAGRRSRSASAIARPHSDRPRPKAMRVSASIRPPLYPPAISGRLHPPRAAYRSAPREERGARGRRPTPPPAAPAPTCARAAAP